MNEHNETTASVPVVTTRPPVLNEPAPNFRGRTTMGERDLASYAGRWLVFFSHPADFTPVCTSEFIAFSKAFDRFQDLDCELLGLSVDSLPSHIAWTQSIARQFGVKVPFPIVEDPSMAIARAYGMLPPGAQTSATVRTTFVIDPAGVIRASITYPVTVGRNVDEILRLVSALQATDSAEISTPEGWQPGDAVILAPPSNTGDLAGFIPSDGADWYYRLGSI